MFHEAPCSILIAFAGVLLAVGGCDRSSDIPKRNNAPKSTVAENAVAVPTPETPPSNKTVGEKISPENAASRCDGCPYKEENGSCKCLHKVQGGCDGDCPHKKEGGCDGDCPHKTAGEGGCPHHANRGGCPHADAEF